MMQYLQHVQRLLQFKQTAGGLYFLVFAAVGFIQQPAQTSSAQCFMLKFT